jgi:uncharacterized DUF497 family protein
MQILSEPLTFIWDRGNRDKNLKKHCVTCEECEEVFFDDKKRMLKSRLLFDPEERYILLGKTKAQRLLFVVFSMRKKKIRVISARDVNRKERPLYEERT